MAALYAPSARLIWSLASSAIGTTISAAGNSGAWSNSAPTQNALSAVDLRDVTDVALMVSVGAISGSPSTTISLSIFDSLGNAYGSGVTTAAITGVGNSIVSGGLHGLTGKQLVLAAWGQIAWTAPGMSTSLSEVEIELWGR
jgi:hypothetical protein